MRVPSTGLSLHDRRIVREGYRLAERLLRDYRDPPLGLIPWARHWLEVGRDTVQALYRDLIRN